MLRKRVALAQEVQDRLVAAERLTDQSIVASAELIVALLKGGQEVNAAAVVGQPAYDQIAAALAASSETRRRLVAAHAELVNVKRWAGLEAIALGGGGNKDTTKIVTGAQLELVEGSRAA